MSFKKILKRSLPIIIISILIILYRTYNPYEIGFFPKCPFKTYTNLKCPGCGSQRAVHYLLNFNLYSALKENAILVFSIPYILTGIGFDQLKKRNENTLKWRKILFGQRAIFVILFLIIGFWILRNIF